MHVGPNKVVLPFWLQQWQEIGGIARFWLQQFKSVTGAQRLSWSVHNGYPAVHNGYPAVHNGYPAVHNGYPEIEGKCDGLTYGHG